MQEGSVLSVGLERPGGLLGTQVSLCLASPGKVPADLSSEGKVLGLVGHVVSTGLLSWACCAPGKFFVGMVALTLRLWLPSCPGFVLYN